MGRGREEKNERRKEGKEGRKGGRKEMNRKGDNIGGQKCATHLWTRLAGKVLMKELSSSVDTSEMGNTGKRLKRTENPPSCLSEAAQSCFPLRLPYSTSHDHTQLPGLGACHSPQSHNTRAKPSRLTQLSRFFKIWSPQGIMNRYLKGGEKGRTTL